MKRYIYTLLLILLPMMLAAQDTVNKVVGDSAYVKGDYASAIEVYETLLSEEYEAAELYYNLGNAYYKTGNVAKALLNYERAALLAPGDEDLQFNMELARSKIVDKVTPIHKFFLVSWLEAVINLMSMQAWCYVGIFFFLLMLATVLVFLFGKSIALRKISFFVAVAAFFVSFFANMSALHLYHYITERSEAIVMEPSVTVKSTPSDSGTELFVIHEGRKVKITDDSMQGWKEIELEDGNVGWVPAGVIEKI